MSDNHLSYEFIGSGRHTVVYCHGLPSGKSFAKVHQDILNTANVMILTFDRPGYGNSPRKSSLDIMDDAKDVLSLLDALNVKEFAVIGVSCGGPTAAAIAALANQRCRFLGLMVAMPPGACAGDERAKNQLPAFKHVFKSAKKKGLLAKIFFKLDCFIVRRNAEKALATIESLLNDSDKAVLKQCDIRTNFVKSLKEAYNNGYEGAFEDAYKIASMSTEFLKDISCQSVYYRANLDRHVTAEMSAVYKDYMPELNIRSYPDSGHVSILRDAENDLFNDISLAML